jgi:predicted nucleic acid-binding protein
MQRIIISDSSCLILLDKIEALYLLQKLYWTITITPEIYEEFGREIPGWIEVRSVSNKKYQKILEAILDRGEASAVALAVENDDSLLIIDDLKGRKYAEFLGLKIIGTLGVLVDAKLSGVITSIKPFLAKVQSTNFRITNDLEKIVLRKSGEVES